ncbi:transporter [Burkholderiaceae bacterium DAT-1]|nr:transporter [Burkholderiaceae bacterium DAT-1]
MSIVVIACTNQVFAAHPLLTDDPETIGKGAWQYELNTDQAVFYEQNVRLGIDWVNSTLTAALTDNLDVSVNVPFLRYDKPEGGQAIGRSDISFGLKYRWYAAEEGLHAGLKAVAILPTGDETAGLGNGRTAAGVNGLLCHPIPFGTLMVNGGLLWTRQKETQTSRVWNMSVAAQIPVTESLTAVAEAGRYSTTVETKPEFAAIGVIWKVNQSVDLDAGLRRGLNDDEVKYSVGVGLTVHW